MAEIGWMILGLLGLAVVIGIRCVIQLKSLQRRL